MKKIKLSKISTLHYYKLVGRSLLFLAATAVYVYHLLVGQKIDLFGRVEELPWLMAVIWIAYAVEMVLRFFPSGMESMGCQKQFRRNYRTKLAEGEKVRLNSAKTTFMVAASWIGLNGIIGILYFTHVIDEGVLLLISLFYGACDMICILFFCPFQTWMMKNKCCGTCRIYNWDYAMMFTPLVFIPNGYTLSLVALSVLLLVRWELAVWRHPEYFCEASNDSLSCANCSEKLCHHKKQLRRFWKKSGQRFHLAGNQILATAGEVKQKIQQKIEQK
ncbi:MAG: hypothetical protein J6Q99_00310 [Oscillospiraceae bacterium]|nr:hypothetical protein [Oscillospiraceae bacterium]